MIINEKHHPNDPIVGCEYVFPVDIDSKMRIGSNKTAVTLVTGKVWHPVYFTPGSALLTTQESLPSSGRLIECSSIFFRRDSTTARICISLVQDISDIQKIVLEKGQTTKAGRLAGAFCNIAYNTTDEIVNTMKSLGYDIREDDSFAGQSDIAYSHDQ